MISKSGYSVPNLIHCTHVQADENIYRVPCAQKGVGVRKMWQAMDTKVGEKARTVPESVLPCPVQILPDRQKQPRHSESD